MAKSGRRRGKPLRQSQNSSGAGRPGISPSRDPLPLPRGSRWVVGLHAAREALRVRPNAVRQIYLREDGQGRGESQEFVNTAEQLGIPFKFVPPAHLDRLCPSHQGVALAVEGGPELQNEDFMGDEPMVVLILDQITDPHNLGAILRTAWLMGAKAVYVPELRASHLSPAATKVASGGAEHVPVIIEKSLPSLIAELKEKGFWIYGLAAEGAQNLWSLSFPEKVAWVVGAEDKGLRTPVAKLCDELVAIFQTSERASYNASVAAAIALSETRRQQKSP